MGKRQEMRQKRERTAKRNRWIAIGLVVVGAVLVAVALIKPGAEATSTASVTPVSTRTDESKGKGTNLGDPNAPVKMDVWEDFQCSGCMYYTKDTEPQVVKAYVDTGKVYYRFHFAPFIDGGQGESHDAAEAAMCAADQGRFWDYHDILFANWVGENVGAYTKPRLVAFAQSLQLDMTAFNSCFNSQKHAAAIQQDLDAGKQRGVPPTPGIFVNDKMVVSSQGANYIPSVDDIGKAIAAGLGQ